jgi:hypothetical protein
MTIQKPPVVTRSNLAVQSVTPTVRDHRTTGSENPNVRDHRSSNTSANAPGGVTVTSSGPRRQSSSSSPCIKSILGGPCMGGTVGKIGATLNKNPISQGIDGGIKGTRALFEGSDFNSRDHRNR